jgi:hypothetical protein
MHSVCVPHAGAAPPVQQLERRLQHRVRLLWLQHRLQHARKELLRVHAARVVNVQGSKQPLQLTVRQVRRRLWQ